MFITYGEMIFGVGLIAPFTSGFNVSSSQVRLPPRAANLTNLAGRTRLAVFNDGLDTVYVGPSGVSTLNGFPIPGSETIVFGVGPDINIYAITAGPIVYVRTLEV